jgi:hypothetical protein
VGQAARATGLLAIALVATACKERQVESEIKDFRAGEQVGADDLLTSGKLDGRVPLLILYINETQWDEKIESTFNPPDDLWTFDVSGHGPLRGSTSRATIRSPNIAKLNEVIAEATGADLNPSNPEQQFFSDMGLTLSEDLSFFTTSLMALMHEPPKSDLYPFLAKGVQRSKGAAVVAYNGAASKGFVHVVPLAGPDKKTEVDLFDFKRDLKGVEERLYRFQLLSHPKTLPALLDWVGKTFPPAQFKYILVVKSHGSSDVAVTPYVKSDIAELPNATVIAQLRRYYQYKKHLKELAGNPEVGIAVDLDGKVVVDATGAPVTYRRGQPLRTSTGAAVLNKDGQPLLYKDGVVILDKEGNPILDKEGNPVLIKDGTNPFLDKDGQPLLEKDSPAGGPLLGAFEASRISDFIAGWKKLANGDTVSGTLSHDEINDAILGGPAAATAGTQLTGQAEVGVNKIDLLKMIAAKERDGMYFPVVVFESCNSQLESSSNDELRGWLTKDGVVSYRHLPIANIGRLFTSDHRGLDYESIKWPQILDVDATRPTLDLQNDLIAYLNKLAATPTRPTP